MAVVFQHETKKAERLTAHRYNLYHEMKTWHRGTDESEEKNASALATCAPKQSLSVLAIKMPDGLVRDKHTKPRDAKSRPSFMHLSILRRWVLPPSTPTNCWRFRQVMQSSTGSWDVAVQSSLCASEYQTTCLASLVNSCGCKVGSVPRTVPDLLHARHASKEAWPESRLHVFFQ